MKAPGCPAACCTPRLETIRAWGRAHGSSRFLAAASGDASVCSGAAGRCYSQLPARDLSAIPYRCFHPARPFPWRCPSLSLVGVLTPTLPAAAGRWHRRGARWSGCWDSLGTSPTTTSVFASKARSSRQTRGSAHCNLQLCWPPRPGAAPGCAWIALKRVCRPISCSTAASSRSVPRWCRRRRCRRRPPAHSFLCPRSWTLVNKQYPQTQHVQPQPGDHRGHLCAGRSGVVGAG